MTSDAKIFLLTPTDNEKKIVWADTEDEARAMANDVPSQCKKPGDTNQKIKNGKYSNRSTNCENIT